MDEETGERDKPALKVMSGRVFCYLMERACFSFAYWSGQGLKRFS